MLKSKIFLIFVLSLFKIQNCLSCGSYNPAFNVCCNGVLNGLAGGRYSTGCCDKLAYHTSFNVCCNGVLNGLAGGIYSTGCCGTKSYHTSFYKCINGAITNK